MMRGGTVVIAMLVLGCSDNSGGSVAQEQKLGALDSEFSLECSGTRQDTTHVPKDENFQKTIHIDLEKKKYCEDDCETISNFSAVTDAEIILTDYKSPPEQPPESRTAKIDRASGAYSYRFDFSGESPIFEYLDGQCELIDISPMETALGSKGNAT